MSNSNNSISERRRERFSAVCEAYEANQPDPSVPGAASGVARYALVTESTSGHGYTVNFCENLERAETAAVANVHEGWQPVCYYDLDQLAGDEPPIAEGDLLSVTGHAEVPNGSYRVVHVSEERRLICENAAAPEDEPVAIDHEEVVVLERGEPDERMPVRYALARLEISAVFNTVPSPA